MPKPKKKRPRGKPPLDLRGKRYGLLTAVKRQPDGRWRCRCDCGNQTVVFRGALRSGHTRSCGCLRRSSATPKPTPVTPRTLTLDGETQTVAEWAQWRGLNYSTLASRLERGLGATESILRPAGHIDNWIGDIDDADLVRLAEAVAERIDDKSIRRDLRAFINELATRTFTDCTGKQCPKTKSKSSTPAKKRATGKRRPRRKSW